MSAGGPDPEGASGPGRASAEETEPRLLRAEVAGLRAELRLGAGTVSSTAGAATGLGPLSHRRRDATAYCRVYITSAQITTTSSTMISTDQTG
nr:hypothetical protein GCM10010200_106850 [Actinomadura rugatobispora]